MSDEKRATGPDLPQRDWTDMHHQMGRLEGRLESVEPMLAELLKRLATLDCGEHRARLDELERKVMAIATGASRSRPPSGETQARPRTGQGYPAITRKDLDDTQEHVIAEMTRRSEDIAERTVEERLAAVEALQERRSQQRRESVRGWLQIVQLVLGIAAGAGVTLAVRCPAQPAIDRAAQLQRAQQPRVDAAGR